MTCSPEYLLQELGQWYRHRFGGKTSNSVVRRLVDGLIDTTRVRPPRKQAPHQLYHERYWISKIKPLFDASWATSADKSNADCTTSADKSDTDRAASEDRAASASARKVGARNSFVKKLFDAEPEDLREELTATVEAEHVEAMKKWKAGLESVNDTGG